jgi:hypothetical protein
MKKVAFLALVCVLVFAVAAPAFAAGIWGDPPAPPDPFTYGLTAQSGTINTDVKAGVQYALAVSTDLGPNYVDLGWLRPGTTWSKTVNLTVKSNSAFTKTFTVTPDAGSEALFGRISMKLDGAAYTSGTAINHAAAASDVEALAFTFAPTFDDQPGALRTGKLAIVVTQQ